MSRLRAAPGLVLPLSLALACACASSSSPPAPKPEPAVASADPVAAPSPPPPAAEPEPAAEAAPAAPEPAAGFTRLDLPGFVVDMPDGVIKTDRRDSYNDGEYVVQTASPGGDVVAMAIWAPGGIVGDPMAEQAMVTATARSAGMPLTLKATHDATVVGARVAKTYDLSYGRIGVLITVAECGRRAISIAAAGVGDAPEEARAKMVASLRCAREDTREASSPPPIDLAMPAGWRRRVITQEEVRWERGADLITFVWTTGSSPAHLASFEGVLPALGFDTRATAAAPIAGRTTWEVRGRGGRLAIGTVIPCGPRFALGIYSGTSDRDARTWLAQARCPD